MSLRRHGRMICFDDGGDRFTMRAAGIALHDGHVLVQRALHDTHWALPGGRMEQGETSGEALLREMQEELLQVVEVGPLGFVVESFFPHQGRQFHEVGLFHRMVVPDAFPRLLNTVCHTIEDGGVSVEFAWLPADPTSLAAAQVNPAPLRPHLAAAPAGVMHLVNRETA